jgi:hypothetical protein
LRRITRRSEPRPQRAKARRRTSERNTKCLLFYIFMCFLDVIFPNSYLIGSIFRFT